LSFLQIKSDPAETQTVLILSAIFGIISLIPLFAIGGAVIDYYNGRLNNQTGLFDVSLATVVKGLKVFPLSLAWIIYITFATLLPLVLFAPFFITQLHKISSVIYVLLLLFAFLFFFVYVLALFLLVAPFVSYIFIEYSKDYKYKKYLFNPLTICRYMKKAFKSTVLINLKLYVSYILLNIAYNIVIFVGFILFVGLLFFIALIFSPNSEQIDVITAILISVPLLVLQSVYTYLQSILNLAVGDNIVKIYKTKIDIPEELEEQEDENLEIEKSTNEE
jgi:hypothetical protein